VHSLTLPWINDVFSYPFGSSLNVIGCIKMEFQDRIDELLKRVDEIRAEMLRLKPSLVDPTAEIYNDQDVPETEGMSREEILELSKEYCERAEKYVQEGKVLSALREEKVCSILISRAAGEP